MPEPSYAELPKRTQFVSDGAPLEVVYRAPPTSPMPEVLFPLRMQLTRDGLPPTFQTPAPPFDPLLTLPEIVQPISLGLHDVSTATPPPPVVVARFARMRQFLIVGETPAVNRIPPPPSALPFVIVIDSSLAALENPSKRK